MEKDSLFAGSRFFMEELKGEKLFTFCCPQDSLLGEVYDALSKMRLHVMNRMIEENKNKEEKKDGTKEAPKP